MKIAVVGSGISGLSCTYLLSKIHDVHLYESQDRLGGHANTIDVDVDGQKQKVDTGFLVFNELTYPNFVKFLKELKVDSVDSDMSLSIQHIDKKIEWAGNSFSSIFAQTRNFFKPSFWQMLFEIRKFQNDAEKNFLKSRANKWSIQDLITSEGFSPSFTELYLLPIGAAIWSTPEEEILEFPAETFLKFFLNHKLLQWKDRPKWKTIKNGSQSYVAAVEKELNTVFKNCPVNSVQRLDSGKIILSSVKNTESYDAVVFATHPPTTLKILKSPSSLERDILGSFEYEKNLVTVHKCSALMPASKKCWSSWNIKASEMSLKSKKLNLTYYINKLQPWIKNEDIFVSLNLKTNAFSTLKEIDYEHPKFNRKAIDSQASLPSIQGIGNIFHVGAWTRYGFHEDGILSSVNIAKELGVDHAWTFDD